MAKPLLADLTSAVRPRIFTCMNAAERIVINPEVCGGRPIVAGTRVRVIDVLNALAAGDTIDELVADFPYLTRPDILACIAYGARAVDHTVVQAA